MSDSQPPIPGLSEKEIATEIAEAKHVYSSLTTEAKATHDLLNEQMKGEERSRSGYQYVAEPAPGYDVVGIWHTFPATTRSGYASHAVALHSMLERMRIPTMLAPHPTMELDTEKFPPDRAAMLMRWHKDVVGVPKAFIGSFPPDHRSLDIGIGVPAYIPYVAFEALPMSEYAKRVCSSPLFKQIWCVSDFTKRCYLESGVPESKLAVVRPAICDGIWAGISDHAPSSASSFVFGVNGTWHERKGFHNLIRAYFSSFSREDDVTLAIRTSYFGSGRDKPLLMDFERQVLGEIGKIKLDYQKPGWKMPNIQLLTGTSLTDAELLDWIGGLDCYVNPSFGEGLGIPPIHAAAQGVPIVTSDFGAVGDFTRDCAGAADQSQAFRVFPSKLVPVPRDMLKHSALLDTKSCWGGYEVGDLADQMHAAFAAGRIRTPGTASLARARFSFDATCGALASALEAVVDEETLKTWGVWRGR